MEFALDAQLISAGPLAHILADVVYELLKVVIGVLDADGVVVQTSFSGPPDALGAQIVGGNACPGQLHLEHLRL